MVKSPVRGIPFLSTAEASNRLRKLACQTTLKTLYSALGKEGQLHIVGGAVRDAFMETAFSDADLDLACAYPPSRTLKLLKNSNIHCIPTGLKHGTVTALLEDRPVEITSFRKPGKREREINTQDLTRSIEEDLSGRDFTINSMAFSLDTLDLLDPFDGTDDLKNGIVKCTGDAGSRFKEDPLRILRMIRFGQCQGRVVETRTLRAAEELGSYLKQISIERIRDEFLRILLAPNAGDGLRAACRLSLLDYILPELLPTVDFEQNEYHHLDVFEHTLEAVDNCPSDKIARLTALFHDLGKPHTLSIGEDGRRHFYKHEIASERICRSAMRRLKFSKADIADVAKLVRHHMRPLQCGPAGVRRIIRDLGEHLSLWLSFKKADAEAAKFSKEDIDDRIQFFNKQVEIEKNRQTGSPFGNLAVNGDDLIEIGFKPGPKLGAALQRLNDLVIESPELNLKGILRKKAKEFLKDIS